MRLRIKDFTTKVGSGVTPRGGATVYQDSGIPLFRSQNITNDGLLTDDIVYISEDIHESMSGSQLKPNDVLLNITGASIGRCYYLPEDFKEGNVNQHVCIIRLKKNVLPAFLYYNLISTTGQHLIDSCQTGANREGLTKEDLCNFEFDIPSIEKQKEIVEYLNEKTALITRQASLLTSKRSAYLRLKKSLITQAVTKGLNPNVKMKPSGIDWIGDVPEGWEVKRGKDVIQVLYGFPADSSNFSDSAGIPLIRIRDINSLETEIRYNGDYPNIYIVHYGDLLIGMDGDFNVAKWKGNDALLNQRVCKINSKKGLEQAFLSFAIEMPLQEINAKKVMTTVKHLSAFDMEQLSIPIPPLPEQRAIATYLDDKCAKIDAIVANIEKQIEKYKALKRALIDEVITGKRTV